MEMSNSVCFCYSPLINQHWSSSIQLSSYDSSAWTIYNDYQVSNLSSKAKWLLVFRTCLMGLTLHLSEIFSYSNVTQSFPWLMAWSSQKQVCQWLGLSCISRSYLDNQLCWYYQCQNTRGLGLQSVFNDDHSQIYQGSAKRYFWPELLGQLVFWVKSFACQDR